jgi:hypothetical protein
MRDFFRKLVRFSLHLALVVVVICVAVRIFLYNTFHEAVIHSKNASTLILGDSHTQWGLVADSIEGAFNFSHSSEQYAYNYKKLQALLEIYPIRVIILNVAYHSFIFSPPIIGQTQQDYYYKYCFTLYPFIREVKKQRCWEIFGCSTMLEVMLCHETGLPSRNTVALIKQSLQGTPLFFTSPRMDIASVPIDWESRIKEHFYEQGTSALLKVDSSTVTGIRDIQSFCKEKGYTLVLFNAPVSQSYYVHIPSVYKQLTDSIIGALVDNQTTFYLDYTQYPLPDSCFRDGDHTNLYGANIITPLVRDSLRSLGLLPML